MSQPSTLILAGGLSGICVDLLLYPLDTLKTRLQVRSGTALPPFSVRAFYRGLASSMLSSFPCAATFWLVYKGTEERLRGSGSGASATSLAYALAPMAASSLAEACVCAIRTPFDVVKQQLQAGLHQGSTAGALRAILRAQGLPGLYVGLSSAGACRRACCPPAPPLALCARRPLLFTPRAKQHTTHTHTRARARAQSSATFPLRRSSLRCTTP